MRAALHDLGNLLTVIAGNCELAQRDLAKGDGLSASVRLGRARQVSLDGCQIIRQVFARRSARRAAAPGCFEINELVRKVAGQIDEQLAERGIELRLDLTETQLLLCGDEMAMQRAIFNLCLNARNAIARSGSIIVSVEAYEQRAVLTVRDTGCGMDAETRDAIWLRKAQGAHGHGLGVVKAAVAEMGGTVEVESEPGHGAIFRMRLPISQPNEQGALAA